MKIQGKDLKRSNSLKVFLNSLFNEMKCYDYHKDKPQRFFCYTEFHHILLSCLCYITSLCRGRDKIRKAYPWDYYSKRFYDFLRHVEKQIKWGIINIQGKNLKRSNLSRFFLTPYLFDLSANIISKISISAFSVINIYCFTSLPTQVNNCVVWNGGYSLQGLPYTNL